MDIKNKLREGLMTNMLGISVTRPNQELIVMRGIPGGGKSTLTNELVKEGVIHSTDTLIEATGDYNGYFAKMIESGNWSAHGKMHHNNFLNAKKSMEEGVTPVIIDNTNIKASESKKYVEAALKMGIHENNIRVMDVGDGGCTAEVLAERNTHSVPLETIKRMMASHKGVGKLTVKKIMESNDGSKKKKFFSSVVLDEKSKSKLLGTLGHMIPEGWKRFAHHMTISFGKQMPEELRGDIGSTVNLMVTHVGGSGMAMAVKVTGFHSTNETPHITIGVNVDKGGKPVMSNDIDKWVKLTSHINLSGVVTEQELR